MEKKYIEVWERVYDCDINKDGSKKPNKFLGEFELLEDKELPNDYSYEVFVKDKDGKICILRGVEVSGYYHPNEGGTKNSIKPVEEHDLIGRYIKLLRQ